MTKKSDLLPKYWSYQRDSLNELLLESEGYKESVEKGLPFFTKEELDGLKNKYPSLITWKEIDAELSRKGMILKKATFRKYIQEKLIPPATDYLRTKTGREARYPRKTIEQINCIQYCYRIAELDMILKLFKEISEQKISAKDAIEEQLKSRNLREAIFDYLRDSSWEGEDIENAIFDVLQDDSEFNKKVTSMLQDIYDSFHEKFDKLENVLERHEVSAFSKE